MGAGLLHGPKLLVLDEPTVGVDPQSRNAILETVADSGEGIAVLYTTHYMEEAARALRPHRDHRRWPSRSPRGRRTA